MIHSDGLRLAKLGAEVLGGESEAKVNRLGSRVAGARYAERLPLEFGVPMEVVIAA